MFIKPFSLAFLTFNRNVRQKLISILLNPAPEQLLQLPSFTLKLNLPGPYPFILDICKDEKRDVSTICVVENVGDLWAIERSGVFSGKYHVLGGVLSALDNIGPDDLKIGQLVQRAKSEKIKEVILANSATVDGQTTAHYIADQLSSTDIILSRLAQGLPMGGELDFLDDGTITQALRARSKLKN